MSDADRNAALYRQRMSQTNQQIGASGAPPRQSASFNPQLSTPPHRPMSVPRPAPPGAPRPVTKMTGSSRKIPPRMDPTNSYHNSKNKELQTATPGDGTGAGYLDGVNKLVTGLIVVVAIAALFGLPKQLKVFWLIIIALTFLIHMGFMLYKEWMAMGKKGEEDAKYAEWASMLLYSMVMLYSAVMAGMLFFMAWSLYSIANSKTNIARLDRAAMAQHQADRKMSEASKQYV
jgi:Flp pilus assembly protein protease CpaA